jgi:DNA-directed RNA polymerase specialized sigma24 family protein
LTLGRTDLESALRSGYPTVCRLAYALCGRETEGRRVVKIIFSQCLRFCAKWKSNFDALNWFLHYTVLRCREIRAVQPDAAGDILVRRKQNPAPEYIAFVRAFRNLPQQQREAFVLFKAERLDPRDAAVAMDCSTQAAANHLIAANKTLSTIAAGTFDAQLDQFARVYASLTPLDELIVGDVNAALRKFDRRRLWRGISTLIKLGFVAALGWLIWTIYKMLVI